LLSERFFAHDKDYSLSGKLGQQKKSNKACLLTKKIYVMGEQLLFRYYSITINGRN